MSEFNVSRRQAVLNAMASLKLEVDKKKYVKVNGKGPAARHEINQNGFREAVRRLESEGYGVFVIETIGMSDFKILAGPSVSNDDVTRDLAHIKTLRFEK